MFRKLLVLLAMAGVHYGATRYLIGATTRRYHVYPDVFAHVPSLGELLYIWPYVLVKVFTFPLNLLVDPYLVNHPNNTVSYANTTPEAVARWAVWTQFFLFENSLFWAGVVMLGWLCVQGRQRRRLAAA